LLLLGGSDALLAIVVFAACALQTGAKARAAYMAVVLNGNGSMSFDAIDRVGASGRVDVRLIKDEVVCRVVD